MKSIVVIGVLLLAGCANVKTLEELEFAALESGDWSAVEMREKNIERRRKERGLSCGDDAVPVCQDRVRGPVCRCRSVDDIDDWMSRL